MTEAHPTEDLGVGTVLVTMASRFTSGNSIPVERTQITRREWDTVAAEVDRLRAELKEARKCKHPTKRGTGSVTTEGKIVTNELWCDTCGEKFS